MTAALIHHGREGDHDHDFVGTIESQVIARLEAYLERRYGGPLQAVKRFEDVISDADEAEVARRLLGQKPAVLLASGRVRYGNASSDLTRYKVELLEVELYLVSQHMHSGEARSEGYTSSVDGGGDPGILRLRADTRRVLWGLQVGRFRPLALVDEEREASIAGGGLVWKQTWATKGLVDHVPVDVADPVAADHETSLKLLSQEGIE